MTNEPKSVTNELQAIQTQIAALRDRYRDSQPEWWALDLLWEAARFAWHVCTNRSFEKLPNVKSAIEALAFFRK